MRRLYLRIYLALLASLLVFALLAGLTAGLFRLADNRQREPWPETSAEIAERLLPPDRDPASLSSDLAFWSEQTGFSLALFSSGGALIAEAGAMPPDIERGLSRHPPRGRFWRARGGIYGLTLKDGRLLIAAPPGEGFGPLRFLRFPAAFLGLALAIAIGFYPLIRHLLRRLERLEAGVARFGAGDLSARVKVKGRDEIAKLAATFNASADRIESLMNAHRLLLAHASHELRSPLSRLRMAIERLKGGAGGEAAQAEAARNIAELDALVEEILLASRLQAGAVTLARDEVDIAGLLAEECAAYGAELTVAEHLGTSFPRKRESMPTQAEQGAKWIPASAGMTAGDQAPPVIQGDARLLRRLFRNVLENAAAHGGPEPPEVTLTSAEHEIRVLVCDRGPGVPEAEREKIFEPFYQVKGRASPGGAGLGLALVREIAARHGGQVRCLPCDGGGACFEVRLPRGRLKT
jgi:signal transduction histidine kinase